jgi:type I restriction enzyme S subunit
MKNKSPISSWQEYSFSEIAKKDKFAIVDGPFGTQLHSDEYTETGIPLVRIENLSFSGKFSPENLVFISEKKANQLNRSRIVPGDLIIAKTGATIGKSGMFPTTFTDGIIASSCMKVSCDPKKVDPKLILYMIVWENGQKKILEGAGGSTRTSINIGPFSDIRLLIPESISEQHKIAEILTTVDDAIEQTEALIRKYQRIKQGLMQDLLTRGVDENGELRPAWEQHPELYKLTEYGWVPNVWNETELGSIAKVERGKFTPRPRNNPIYYQGKYPFIQTGEVASAQGRIIYNFAQTLNELGKKVSREFLQGTILVTIAANIGETGILGIPMYVPDSLVGIVVNSPHDIRFIEMILRARKSYLNARAPQSAQKNINLGDLRPMRIYLPNPKEQNLIAGIYESIEDNIDNEEKELEKLLKIKQGLMQDLLTGKVRVDALLKN